MLIALLRDLVHEGSSRSRSPLVRDTAASSSTERLHLPAENEAIIIHEWIDKISDKIQANTPKAAIVGGLPR